MKPVPRNPDRRKQWQIETKRENWTPSYNSYLCDADFAAYMCEKVQVDGTRPIKWNAMPTIF
nr:unnamed protein product [Callosobruchus analis]